MMMMMMMVMAKVMVDDYVDEDGDSDGDGDVLQLKTSLSNSNFITRLLFKNNCYAKQ